MKNLAKFFLPLLFMVMLSGCVATRPTSTTPPPDFCPDRPAPIAICPEVAPQAFVKKKYINSIGMEFVFIPPGCFVMGSHTSDENKKAANAGNMYEIVAHTVDISRGFWMQTTEVTQEHWNRIMGDNRMNTLRGKNLPVVYVSWDDTQKFISRLNAKEKGSYRLPTYAEWEYACRGGKVGEAYCGGNDRDAVAWTSANASQIHPVAGKRANGFGLYDMSGNVEEWVNDWLDKCDYRSIRSEDHLGPLEGTIRACRGGSWFSKKEYSLAAIIGSTNRAASCPDCKSGWTGFRVVTTSVQ